MIDWKPPFTADEVYRAFRLVSSEEEAREMAEAWDGLSEDREAVALTLVRGSYLLLSVLGGETAEKVAADHLVRLSDEERAAFEAEAELLRAWLKREGKL